MHLYRYLNLTGLILGMIFLAGLSVEIWADESAEKLFKKRCSQCHDLPSPTKLSSEEWVLRLELMAPMAGLDKKQKQEVLGFLQSHSKKAVKIVTMAKEQRVFEEKCTACHSADRVFLMKLTPESRRHIVLRMQERAPDLISFSDVEEVLKYLEHGAPGAKKPQRKPVTGGAQAVFRERCSACHSLERVYHEYDEHRFKASGWMHIVKRMREKAPDWISEGEAEQIIEYLKELKPVKPHNP